MAESGLHILSLDGGGISALSELLMIKELMARIGARKCLPKPPLPHEYFHLIGGTGTGGLVAILLGRLKLDIDRAIECWLYIMRNVFTRKKIRESEGAFSATALEQAINRVLEKYAGEDKNMIKADGDESCKVVVYARNADALRAGIATSIRTYRAYSNQGPECTIVEAVRATMATPGIFKPKTILEGGVPQTYVGGSLGINNPTDKLLAEVQPGQSVASIISIGAGQLRGARLTNPQGENQKLPERLAAALKTMAEDCEGISETMSEKFEDHVGYYRFNVEQGMQDLDPHSPGQMGDAKAHTQNYLSLHDPNRRMNKAVEKIINGIGTMMIKGGNVVSDSWAHAGGMPYCNEPEGLRPSPNRTLTEPTMDASERRTAERLLSLPVPRQQPWGALAGSPRAH